MPSFPAYAEVKISKESSSSVEADSTDPIIAAQLAAAIAEDTDLSITNNVNEHADTVVSQNKYDTSSLVSQSSVKAVDTSSTTQDDSRKANITYISIEGDNINTIADSFKIKPDTVRWANNISGDAVEPGRELLILPVDGLLHKVSGSDNLQTLAKKYKASEDEIVNYNKLTDRKLVEGNDIVIPNGVKPTKAEEEAEKAKTTKTVQTTNVTVNNLASSGYSVSQGNTYSYGYCTWHAANRRAAIGRPIPNRWGNAITWASSARASGYGVDGNPAAGDVLYHKYQGGAGHVAYVEEVNADGSILVSDMNYNGGWGRVSYRTVTPGEFSQYLFIH